MADITIDRVRKSYGSFTAVKEFSLSVADGEFVSILGPSGCGKTTLLRSIAGFFPVDSGEIRIGGTLVASSSDRIHIPPEKRDLGMVFQSYAVWPHMNVFDNVAYPLRIRKEPASIVRDKVREVLELLNLSGSEEKFPSMMSGGQQQRIALGRALIMNPAALLLDEPLSNLDSKLRERMRFELKEIQRKLHLTILYVTHDQEEAMAVSDRIVLMNEGRIRQAGSPEELYEKPENLFSARFLGRSNEISGTISAATGDRIVLETASGLHLPLKPSHSTVMEAGADATAVIRYEKTVIRGDSREDGIPGKVLVGTYFGGYFLYAVETDFGEMIAYADAADIHPEGKDVRLGFSDAFLLEADE